MKWIIVLSMVFSVTSYAQVSAVEVESMLNQMVKENVISAVEAEKAKIKLKTISPDQWSMINEKATAFAARGPASVSENKIEEVQKVDLDSAQFKTIQNEVKKIMPAYKD